MEIGELTIEVRDPSYTRIGQFRPTDLVGAKFILKFNNVGSWEMKLPQGSRLGEFLRLPGYGVIVTGPSGTVLFSGPTLSAQLLQTADNVDGDWSISGVSDDIALIERLAYPTPSTADVTEQTDASDDRLGFCETIIKEYVSANIGPNAPAVRQIANLSIQATSNLGETVQGAARFQTLQEVLYGLAQTSNLGYTIEQLGTGLEFKVYSPLDRTSTVRMDMDNAQLSRAEYAYGVAKVTRAIVGGQGEEQYRRFVEVTNTDSLAAESEWSRRIEVFTDGRNSRVTEFLLQDGAEFLVDQGKTIVEIAITPSDDLNMRFGVDWYLGDKVTVVINTLEASAVVTEVGISIEADGVRIGAKVGTPVGLEFESKLIAKTSELNGRVSNLERNIPIGDAIAIGDVVTSATVKDPAQYLLTDGKVYLQANYPELYAVLGQPVYSPNTKLATPATIPPGAPVGATMSADGQYFVVSTPASNYITIYKYASGAYSKLPDPAVLPPGAANGSSMPADAANLTVSHGTVPYITNYSRSGDVFTKLASPATIPPGGAISSAYSADGAYMIVTFGSSPYFLIYSVANDVYTVLPDPASLPPASVSHAAFSGDGTWLAVLYGPVPYFSIYKRVNGVYVKQDTPAVYPTGACNGLSWTDDASNLAISHPAVPYLTMYRRDDDIFTQIALPGDMPTAATASVLFTADGGNLALIYNQPPFITFYQNINGLYRKLPNLADPPAGAATAFAFASEGAFAGLVSSSPPYVASYIAEAPFDTATHFILPELVPSEALGSAIPVSKYIRAK